jgi:hypothetical protein
MNHRDLMMSVLEIQMSDDDLEPARRFYAWLTRRLRYRNRKGRSTARRFGVPRFMVGADLTFRMQNGSVVFTRKAP